MLQLPDVNGIFYLNDRGKLIASTLPQPFTTETFKGLSRHIMDFFDAADANRNQTDEYFLKFNEHSLYLRRNRICVLGVFTTEKPNITRLRHASDRLLK